MSFFGTSRSCKVNSSALPANFSRFQPFRSGFPNLSAGQLFFLPPCPPHHRQGSMPKARKARKANFPRATPACPPIWPVVPRRDLVHDLTAREVLCAGRQRERQTNRQYRHSSSNHRSNSSRIRDLSAAGLRRPGAARSRRTPRHPRSRCSSAARATSRC